MNARIPRTCNPNRNRNWRRTRFIAASTILNLEFGTFGHSSLPTTRACGTSRSATGDTATRARTQTDPPSNILVDFGRSTELESVTETSPH
jgi:hypothetical protein